MNSLDRVRQKPGPSADGSDSPSAPVFYDEDLPTGASALWAVAAAALFLFAVVVLTWGYIL